MTEKKKDSAFKLVLMIFGIIFSVVLVPGLILGIPVGGAVVALPQAVSQEGIEMMLKEAKLSENLHSLIMTEVDAEVAEVDELNPEFWNGLVRDSISIEFIDEIVTEYVDCLYNGTEPELEVKGVIDGFKSGLGEISDNGFDDIYSACFNGTESKYFSTDFVLSVKEDIENEVLGNHPEFGVSSLDELETLYDAQFGVGAYEKLLKEEVDTFKQNWSEEFLDEVNSELDNLEVEIETEMKEILIEGAQDEDIRAAFDMFKELSANKDKVKLIAYGIVLAAVLLLLVCFWFGTAGFVVPSVALILGGLLCKLVTCIENPLLDMMRAEIATEPGMEEVESVVMDLFRGIFAPFFAEMSKFGYTMMGIGVLLILLAILKHVMKKNMHASEEMM